MKKFTIIILSFLFIFINCEKQEQVENGQNSSGRQVVTTVKLEKEIYQPSLEFTGSFKPHREANLSAVLPGRVEKIFFAEGEKVNQGDLIVQMAGEKLTQAKMEYQALKKDYGRIKRLFEKNSISEQKYDHVKAQYEAKKANYEMIRKNTEIRAPFSGTLVETMIQEGESFIVLNPGIKPGYSHANGVVRLMQLDSLKIEIQVNEKQLPRISKGQKAKITTAAYPGKTFHAAVTKISPIVNMSSRTVAVTLELANPDKQLKPGMFCYVNIMLPQREAVFVPQDAIYRQPGTGNDYLFVVKSGGQVARQPIERLDTHENRVAIEGVEAGETIVVEGKSGLQSGSLVRVANK